MNLPLPSFVLPPNGIASPEDVVRRRQMAQALMQGSIDTSPIASPWQGAARIAQALVGGLGQRKAAADEQAGRAAANAALVKALGGGDTAAMADYLSNPYASSGGTGIVANKWAQMNDPARALELQKLQYEVGHLGKPKPEEPYTLSPGQQRFGPNNQQIASVPEKPDLTDDIKEFNLAKQQGYQGSLQDWIMMQKGQGITIGPDGTVQIGGPVKAMTEAQSKDAMFYSRMVGAGRQLDPIASDLADFQGQVGSQIESQGGISGVGGNYLKPDKYKRAEQAGREWLAPMLRKDTGAAVTPQEFIIYGGTYLPRAGDDKETIKRKAEARKRAEQALKAGMSPQAILQAEQALQGSQQAAPPSPQQPAPAENNDPFGIR